MRSAREQVLHIPTSLMSAASAHTLKPSLEAPGRLPLARPAQNPTLKFMALAATSAAFGLAGAAGLSHFRPRPAPLAQIVSGNPTLKKGADGASVRWHSQRSKIYFDASLDNAGK